MIRPDGTVADAILPPITEAQRVPSIGTQLTLTPEPRIVAARCARRATIARREDRATTYQLRTLAGLPVRVATVRALEL